MVITASLIQTIHKMREQGLTVGDIADRIWWPEAKSLKQLQAICDKVRGPVFEVMPSGPLPGNGRKTWQTRNRLGVV